MKPLIDGHWTEEARSHILFTADELDKEARETAQLAATLRLFVLQDRWKEQDHVSRSPDRRSR